MRLAAFAAQSRLKRPPGATAVRSGAVSSRLPRWRRCSTLDPVRVGVLLAVRGGSAHAWGALSPAWQERCLLVRGDAYRKSGVESSGDVAGALALVASYAQFGCESGGAGQPDQDQDVTEGLYRSRGSMAAARGDAGCAGRTLSVRAAQSR